MRILVFSNLYPPYYLGGYELACKDVVERLKQRGHEVIVVTSTYKAPEQENDPSVYRCLSLNSYEKPTPPVWQYAWNQLRNSWKLVRIIKRVNPDIIYVWSMGRLEPSLRKILPAQSHHPRYKHLPRYITIPIVFAISDPWLLWPDCDYIHWIEYWEHNPQNLLKRWVKSWLERMLSTCLFVHRVKPLIRYAHFFSRSLREQYANSEITPENTRIIYHGVPIEKYDMAAIDRIPQEGDTLQCLYCGQIAPDKGVHTAIEGLAILRDQKNISNITLTIVGPAPYQQYLQKLHQMIIERRLQNNVFIHRQVQRDEMERIYNHHDVLIFPSIWKEPFSIVLLEAMAHGLAVVATQTGGSAEILRHEENCLVFAPNVPLDLANQIERLFRSPELAISIKRRAIETIRINFTQDIMIEKIERYLLSIYNAN